MKEKKIEKFIENIKQTYSNKNMVLKYNLISSGILFLILYTLLTWTNKFSYLKFILLNGPIFSFFSLLLIVLISLVMGINIGLLRMKYVKSKELGNEKGSILVFLLSFFGTGCPVCGTLILGLLGFPLALNLLPFKGLEINFLTLVLMIFSAYYISKKLDVCESCKVKKR